MNDYVFLIFNIQHSTYFVKYISYEGPDPSTLHLNDIFLNYPSTEY